MIRHWRRRTTECAFGVPIVEDNGQKLLILRTGPTKAWKLLQLLDDNTPIRRSRTDATS
jgi:hypothetical protein